MLWARTAQCQRRLKSEQNPRLKLKDGRTGGDLVVQTAGVRRRRGSTIEESL
jgi:hypothetical protein